MQIIRNSRMEQLRIRDRAVYRDPHLQEMQRTNLKFGKRGLM
jgi:hypothetical protein